MSNIKFELVVKLEDPQWPVNVKIKSPFTNHAVMDVGYLSKNQIDMLCDDFRSFCEARSKYVKDFQSEPIKRMST